MFQKFQKIGMRTCARGERPRRRPEEKAPVRAGQLPCKDGSDILPWYHLGFTGPSRARPRCCGVWPRFLCEKTLTAGRGNGRTRRGLRALALRPRSSETIFGSLFPARFHRRGSLEGSMRKPTLLFTADLVILSELYAKWGDLSTGKTKFFGGMGAARQRKIAKIIEKAGAT